MKSYAMSSSEIVSKQNLKKFDIRRVERRRFKVESNDIETSPKNGRTVLTARGSGLEFGAEMEPDLVRGAATRKSIPEPVWPRAGKVADQVKVFNERSSPPRNTIIEIKNDSQSATLAATTSSRATVIPIKPSPSLPPTSPSPLPPFASTTTSHRFNVFDTSNDSTGASSNRSKSFPAPKRYPEMRRFPGHFQPNRDMSPIGECPSHDETEEERKTFGGHNDSIVTEALLRMTDKTLQPSSASNQITTIANIETDDIDSLDIENVSPRRNEDMDNVIRELTLAVIKSKNVSTLTRAFKSAPKVGPKQEIQFSETGAVIVREKLTRTGVGVANHVDGVDAVNGVTAGNSRLRNSFRTLKSRSSKSVDAMKDLWKQTGMKTNGRKLLMIDNNDLVAMTTTLEGDERRQNQRRRRRKRACRIHRRVHTNVTSSSSQSSSHSSQSTKITSRSNSDACSDTSPPYVGINVGVGGRKPPLTYSSSTEVYAEVYDEESEKRKSSKSTYQRPISNTETIDLDDIDVGTSSTTCYSRSTSSSASSSSSPSPGSRKSSTDRTCSTKCSKDRKSSSSNDKHVKFKQGPIL